MVFEILGSVNVYNENESAKFRKHRITAQMTESEKENYFHCVKCVVLLDESAVNRNRYRVNLIVNMQSYSWNSVKRLLAVVQYSSALLEFVFEFVLADFFDWRVIWGLIYSEREFHLAFVVFILKLFRIKFEKLVENLLEVINFN